MKRRSKARQKHKSSGDHCRKWGPFEVEQAQCVPILSALRQWLPNHSWSAVRKLLHGNRVLINGALCVDQGRRLSLGETVTIVDQPLRPPPGVDDVVIRLVDRHIVVAEKPTGMLTVRHSSERRLSVQRRLQQPALDDAVAMRIARHASSRSSHTGRVHRPRLWAVHRLDRDSSGLVVFARNERSQQHLIQQFAAHHARRIYLALVPGKITDQTIETRQVKDRGDGRRGNARDVKAGKEAITHVRTLRRIRGYSELECRLETGRTNQIRIHLAELGHPICGDIKYRGRWGEPDIDDTSGCPRLALHAAQLCFEHPQTEKHLEYHCSWPDAMLRFLMQLEQKEPK